MRLSKLEVLSDVEKEMIHRNSLRILEEIGMKIDSIDILDMLYSKGCKADHDKKMVKFPAGLVEKCLKTIPPVIRLVNRDGDVSVILGNNDLCCVSGHNAIFTLDDRTGIRRAAVLKDVEEFAVVSDHLEDVDMIGVPYSPQDVAAGTALLYSVKAIMDNSKKPVFYSCESRTINMAVIEMAKAVFEGKDNRSGSYIVSQLSTTSPLYWEKGAVESLYLCAVEGIPITFLPQPIAGVTAPYTLAGLLTVHNAEVLSGIVISQLANPGLPVIYGAAWTTYEMRHTNVLIGRPESSLLRIAGAQMAHYYNMPSHTTAPDNDSNIYDEQASWEKMLSTVAGAAGSNDMIVNLGMFGTGMSISLEQLVMDAEICRIVKRFCRGIDINENKIAFDTISNVGIRGTYFIEDNTLENLRSGEHEALDISNGTSYEIWKRRGMKDSYDTAGEIVKTILGKGSKNPAGSSVSRKFDDIIEKYEKSGI